MPGAASGTPSRGSHKLKVSGRSSGMGLLTGPFRTQITATVFLGLWLLVSGCRTTVLREQPAPTPGAVASPAATMAPVPAAPQAVPATSASPAQPAAAQPSLPSSAILGSPVAVAPVASPSSVGAGSPNACRYAPSRRLAEAQDRAIREASALVASQRWPGIYWTVNDSGNSPTLYALDEQGRNRGSFRVQDADNEDWEAMQLGPGRDGKPALYIGDIGDNDRKRKEVVVYRVPEPEPAAGGAKPTSGRTADAEAFTLAYADGPRDAETLIVHPATGELLVLTKESIGRAGVYRLASPLEQRKRLTLERIGTFDMAPAGVKLDVVTDGSVAPDGRRLAIRTYGSVLEFDLGPNTTLASVWGGQPRVARLDDGVQAESLTYRADGKALISISEGQPAPLFETVWQCG
jgi:hypothetical protein